MADFINGTPKFVASTTLGSVNWENSTVLTGDVADAVADLKGQAGKDIAINGSGTLVRSLLAAGLVDELQLLVHPIVVGRGKHLFEEGRKASAFELAGSETFGTGVLNLTYKPAAAQRAAAEAKGVPAHEREISCVQAVPTPAIRPPSCTRTSRPTPRKERGGRRLPLGRA